MVIVNSLLFRTVYRYYQSISYRASWIKLYDFNVLLYNLYLYSVYAIKNLDSIWATGIQAKFKDRKMRARERCETSRTRQPIDKRTSTRSDIFLSDTSTIACFTNRSIYVLKRYKNVSPKIHMGSEFQSLCRFFSFSVTGKPSRGNHYGETITGKWLRASDYGQIITGKSLRGNNYGESR